MSKVRVLLPLDSNDIWGRDGGRDGVGARSNTSGAVLKSKIEGFLFLVSLATPSNIRCHVINIFLYAHKYYSYIQRT